MSRWEGKVALITGGSAGLGLVIASEFGRQGAIAVIAGRDSAKLKSAVNTLHDQGCLCDSIEADVTDSASVKSLIETLIERFGRLDVLVNNVGKSCRTSLENVTVDDFRDYLETNFLSAVSCTQEALPWLKKADGHIVNIGSLAAKTAWPFMAPYSASKFALASYTHQLRLEGPENVHYILVCPGPLSCEDSGLRY